MPTCTRLLSKLTTTAMTHTATKVSSSSSSSSSSMAYSSGDASSSFPSCVPRPLVLCGPSGSGKSTLMKRLTQEFPNAFGFSVSHTTRKPRPGEQEAVHYHFVSRPDLETAVARGEFIESAEFSGNMYGTSVKAVENVMSKGKICILDIEMQGVMQIKEKQTLNCQYVFIRPPSMSVLETRLRERGTETEEALKKRLDTARKEMEYGEEGKGNFDIVITNDDLDHAYKRLREFVLPEIQRAAKE